MQGLVGERPREEQLNLLMCRKSTSNPIVWLMDKVYLWLTNSLNS